MRNNRIKRSNRSRIESVVILNSESYHDIEVSEAVAVLNDHQCTRYRLIWLLIYFSNCLRTKNSRANIYKNGHIRARIFKNFFSKYSRANIAILPIFAREFSKTCVFSTDFKELYGWDEEEIVCGAIFFSASYD